MAHLPPSRRLRRRERARRRRFLAGAVVTLILIAGSLVWLSKTPVVGPAAPGGPDADGSLATLAMATEPVVGAADQSVHRPLNPHSIIPGGPATPAAPR